MSSRSGTIWWGVAYAALVGATVWGLVAARHWALDTQVRQPTDEAWQKYRSDVQRQQQSGNYVVQRRVPTSPEPPLRVMLRDHFAALLVGCLVFNTIVVGFLAWTMSGALAQRRKVASQQPAAGRRDATAGG
jgi:hypothetical protein